ncbi:hypothetical protein AC578_2020 [Pseudocercospora eumusae]|uniref:Uncharacterized protein n=1 Tax=Pseudocercospora eumusae TaxID=321146 RepID=A0A139HH89_9PEZI|nr:hypothetical protein AC578_2020 [Pseudocercospora eumusae]
MEYDDEVDAVDRRFYANLLESPSMEHDVGLSLQQELTSEPEHVLRGTKSFTARSWKSRASTATLRVSSNRSNMENLSVQGEDITRPTGLIVPASGEILGEIAPNGQLVVGRNFKLRPSPTPSLKKKKVEELVKAHGSPQHMRVTAGGKASIPFSNLNGMDFQLGNMLPYMLADALLGRIVPSDQSPLCHPRFGYSAIKANGGLIKFAPNHRPGEHEHDHEWELATKDGSLAQDRSGQLYQIVNGTVLRLREQDGAVQLYMPAPNLDIMRAPAVGLGPVQRPLNMISSQQNERIVAPEPSNASKITALELEYSKREGELKQIDRNEAIHGRTMHRAAKDELVATRRELVIGMDKIRKDLKKLKSQPPQNAPTSPRAMRARDSVSPPGRRQVPPFLHMQPSSGIHAPQRSYSALVGGQPDQYRPSISHEEYFAVNPWAVAPPGIYAPPPFDGSMAGPAFPAYPSAPAIPGTNLSLAVGNLGGSQDNMQPHTERLAHLSIESPRSHAVSIKAPDTRLNANAKSGLNPMSPVYKPGFPAAAAAKSSSNTLSAGTGSFQKHMQPAKSASDETVSPAKRDAHLHSSSVSSLGTADFFPRNPQEYSTRQHIYPQRAESSDKESAGVHTLTPSQANEVSAWKARAPDTGDYNGKVPPPGTPVFHSDATTQAPLPSSMNENMHEQRQMDVPNRDADNISPKNKREWLFIEEDPSGKQQEVPSSQPSEEPVNFANKSRAWIEGFQAGLQRFVPDPHRTGDYLVGYCQGLLKSHPQTANAPSAVAASTGSPMKTHARRPSPAFPSRSNSRVQMPEKIPVTSRAPLESNNHSIDTLKQAVIAPQNENAVLTPSAEGPHVADLPVNLGAWAKQQHSSPSGPATGGDKLADHFIPKRAIPLDRQVIMSEGNNDARGSEKTSSTARASDGAGTYLLPSSNQMPLPASPTTSTRSIASSSIASGGAPDTGHRITSLNSIDANMYRQWPSNRIMTPTEWKTSGSLAHAAGLATGYFAAAQFDGTNEPSLRGPGQLTRDVAGAPQRVGSGGRFREGSLDGIASPPMSPTMSPSGTPSKDSGKKKNASPAKAKFEHVAEKMGIKIASDAGVDGAADSTSPRGKRSAWRDL